MSWQGLLITYLLGGISFIPTVLVAFYYFSLWYLPNAQAMAEETAASEGKMRQDEMEALAADDDNADALFEREQETGTEVYLTGWLTLSREYFIYPTGGPRNSLNPPTSDKNDASLEKNESAYSSLYKLVNSPKSSTRSVDSTGKSEKPRKGISKLHKYFAVLRHGNLFLYADAEQTNVKHVIVIAKHIIMMWPPNVTDGELFIKRSAICLAKLNPTSLHDIKEGVPPKDAFYLYSDDCSEKEDFYFALIRASKRTNFQGEDVYNPNMYAHPLHHKTTEIMELIQTLHSTDANLQTRWLNAILGRLFLSLKDTAMTEEFFRKKIVNKLARVKRPTYLGEIEVNKIDCGHSIPYFTHPKLKDFTPEGLMIVEANLSYSGNFTVEIATKAILNLGARFKTRDVSLVLSVTTKSVEGKMVFKIKPPPSSRIWYAFETMPKLKLDIEPVVSSKQITYSLVTNAIEKRFREVVRETLVLPFMDDLTFFDTNDEFYRGGIWDHNVRKTDNKMDATSATPVPDRVTQSSSSAVESDETRTGLRHRPTSTSAEFAASDADSVLSSTSVLPPRPVDSEVSSVYEPQDHLISDQASDISNLDLNRSSQAKKSPTLLDDIQAQYREERSAGSSKAEAALGTVKKWSSWYFGNKKQSNVNLTPTTSSQSSPVVHRPKAAPAAHNFPPELMSSLETGRRQSYGPAPEMKVPRKYPTPPPPPVQDDHKQLGQQPEATVNSSKSVKRKPVTTGAREALERLDTRSRTMTASSASSEEAESEVDKYSISSSSAASSPVLRPATSSSTARSVAIPRSHPTTSTSPDLHPLNGSLSPITSPTLLSSSPPNEVFATSLSEGSSGSSTPASMRSANPTTRRRVSVLSLGNGGDQQGILFTSHEPAVHEEEQAIEEVEVTSAAADDDDDALESPPSVQSVPALLTEHDIKPHLVKRRPVSHTGEVTTTADEQSTKPNEEIERSSTPINRIETDVIPTSPILHDIDA